MESRDRQSEPIQPYIVEDMYYSNVYIFIFRFVYVGWGVVTNVARPIAVICGNTICIKAA